MEDELRRINDLHLWDFEVASFDAGTLLLLGSNDFVYSHYLEAEFSGVEFTDLPPTFSHAEFRLGARYGDTWSIWVTAESMNSTRTEFEIQAVALEVRIGRVYYYDRKGT